MNDKGIQPDKLEGDFVKPGGEISRRELFQRLSPLGNVDLDSSRCTGCGLCAGECPTEALMISSNEETYAFQLLFRYDHCVACGSCVEICPEKCLRMERVFDLGKMDSQSVLFEDEIVRCSKCGSPIGPKVMIDKMQARVVTARHSFPSQPELCPACKIKTHFSQLSVSNGHIG
ncbi:4Fe-4S dicluster domain-containing protein [Chloroflexota bacterium]